MAGKQESLDFQPKSLLCSCLFGGGSLPQYDLKLIYLIIYAYQSVLFSYLGPLTNNQRPGSAGGASCGLVAERSRLHCCLMARQHVFFGSL